MHAIADPDDLKTCCTLIADRLGMGVKPLSARLSLGPSRPLALTHHCVLQRFILVLSACLVFHPVETRLIRTALLYSVSRYEELVCCPAPQSRGSDPARSLFNRERTKIFEVIFT